jgi:N-methylhydantoinase B
LELTFSIKAQVAAAKIGAERYIRLVERYGKNVVNSAYQHLLASSEKLMREAISELPDGTTQCWRGFMSKLLPRCL